MATLNYRNFQAWETLWTFSCLGLPFQLWQMSPAVFPKRWLRFGNGNVNGNAIEVQKFATYRQSGCIRRAGLALHPHRAHPWDEFAVWPCSHRHEVHRKHCFIDCICQHIEECKGVFFHKQWAMVPMCIKAYTVSKQDENNGRQSYSKATQIACIIQSHTERVW